MDSAIVVVVILSSSLKVWRCWRQVQFHSQTSCSNEFCPFLLYRHTTSTFNVEQFVYNRRRCRTCLQFFHHLFPFSTFYIVIHCTTIFSFVIQFTSSIIIIIAKLPTMTMFLVAVVVMVVLCTSTIVYIDYIIEKFHSIIIRYMVFCFHFMPIC